MIKAHYDPGCKGHRGEALCVDLGRYNPDTNEEIKRIAGSRWSKIARHWHIPAEASACRHLRIQFGDRLQVTKALSRWYTERDKLEREMHAQAQATTGTLSRLWEEVPGLARAVHIGPRGRSMTPTERQAALSEPGSYQVPDVRYLVRSPAPLNGNHQGLGKTVEWIAAIYESGMEEGDHLVLCPRSAVEGTWEKELHNWLGEREDVEVFALSENRDKGPVVKAWQASTARTRFLVINPGKVRARKDKSRKSDLVFKVSGKKKEAVACYCLESGVKGAHEHYLLPLPQILETKWTTVCVDEAHKEGYKDPKSLLARTLKKLDAEKIVLMTGTPMSKMHGWDLWGLLHFQNPGRFGSKWAFVDGYYEIIENYFGKEIGPLREDREADLFRMLAPFVLRRKKEEVFSQLPPKQYIEVPCSMTPRQRTQYRLMSEESWAPSGKDEIQGLGTLPRRTRLKQLANAHSKIQDGVIVPIDSPKVDAMLDNVLTIGGKHLVFTCSRQMAEFAGRKLVDAGLNVGLLTGKVKRARDRLEVIDGMQTGDLDVAVIVTKAGGTSLTLDEADTVHFIDESDNPGDDEQAEDRAHRVSRIHQVTVYIYRMKETIDFDIKELKRGKSKSHARLLDERRSITSSIYHAETR